MGRRDKKMSESVAEGGGVSTEKWRWTFATKHV